MEITTLPEARVFLREARLAAGLGIDEAASISEVPRNTLYRAESGNPKLSVVLKLLATYGAVLEMRRR